MENTKLFVLMTICIFSLAILLGGCSKNSDSSEAQNNIDNTSTCEECQYFDGEKCLDYECCVDSDCLDSLVCEDHFCVEIECYCGYIENNKCIQYECCKNTECNDDEECEDNKCIELECGYCSYADRHRCKSYECCKNSDCDDSNSSTRDYCENPSKTTAKCVHEIICKSNTDCDDKNNCTNDKCVRTKCEYTPVTVCKHDDGCCPEACIFQTDNDCPKKDLCSKDSDCDDHDVSTKNQCLGTPKVCVFTKITECISNDSYCPSGCNNDNDLDCVDTRSNLNISGPVTVLSFCRGAQGKLCMPDCQSQQVVVFFVHSTFAKDKEVMFEYQIDGELSSVPAFLNVVDNQSFTNTKLKEGLNQVFFKIDESLSGKNLTIRIDPDSLINESKRDNEINKIFENFSSDLKVEEIYIDSDNQIYVNLSRSNITLQCPFIENKVYLNDSNWPFIFSGFDGKNAYLKSPISGIGNHTVRVEIDISNAIQDPNRENNVLEQMLELV